MLEAKDATRKAGIATSAAWSLVRPIESRIRARDWFIPAFVLLAADAAAVSVSTVLTGRMWSAGATSGVTWLVPLVFLAAFVGHGLYDRQGIGSGASETRKLLQAGAVATAVAGLLVVPGAPRGWMLGLFATAVGLTGAGRIGARGLRRAVTTPVDVVVVGTDDRARAAARALDRGLWMGYRPLGFVQVAPNAFGRIDDLPILGSADNLDEIIAQAEAGAVVLSLETLRPEARERIHELLAGAGVEVWTMPSPEPLPPSRVHLDRLDDTAVVRVRPPRRSNLERCAKRALDITVSLALLLVTAPVVAVVSLAIKLSSSGPVLFRQVRVGQEGEHFVLFKFRTMVNGAHARVEELQGRNEADGVLFKLRHDPRVTAVGRLLRRTSLDELPQLLNVLRGEMSLVGPRPALPEETERYEGELAGRLRVRPGLTGLWQVNGRQELSFPDYVHYDLLYAEHWSLGLDLRIILRTVPAVLSGRGSW